MSGKDKLKSDPTLDPSWLYQVLREEIKKEVKYDLENSAKLRAVTQGTVNYEQFRQMVLGAHIRPLERTDKVEGCQNGKRPHVVWNTAVPKAQQITRQTTKDPSKENPSEDGSSSSTGIFTASSSPAEDKSQKTPQDNISLRTTTKKRT